MVFWGPLSSTGFFAGVASASHDPNEALILEAGEMAKWPTDFLSLFSDAVTSDDGSDVSDFSTRQERDSADPADHAGNGAARPVRVAALAPNSQPAVTCCWSCIGCLS